MARDKKSFVLYSDSQSLIKQLPDDVAGRLLKHIFAYVNDENPISDELLVNIAFEPIKNQLKRDLKKYEISKEIKSQGGRMGNLKRWNLDLYNQVLKKELSIEDAEKIAENRKVSHSDVERSHSDKKIAVNDNVSVSVNVNDNVNVSTNVDVDEKENFDDDFQNFKILFYKNLSDDFDFTFEIQKIKNQLDEEISENQKTFLSQKLNFLISEKRKKVPPKKENSHQDYVDELKISSEWLGLISMQNKNIPIESIISKLDEFTKHLKSSFKIHETKTDFVNHFKSWLPKKIPDKPNSVLTHNR
jgi:hypothetical protein